MQNSNFFPLSTAPNLTGIVNNLGSSYSGLEQAVDELVDNAASNLRAPCVNGRNPHLVRLTVEEGEFMVGLVIEDAGSGIADLNNAFRIAGTAAQQTPLNEHGQGLKQALAYITKNGGDWSLDTRTEADRLQNRCIRVAPPYNALDGQMQAEIRDGWSGELSSTGTVIRISCPYNIFSTLEPSVNGNVPFARLVSILEEDLRYTYADLLDCGDLIMELISIPRNGTAERRVLKPLLPSWKEILGTVSPTQVNLGGGMVTVSGTYGIITASSDAEYHYQANLATSGAVISVNGRIISGHLFGQIWKKAHHPSGNGFLLRLDIHSDDLNALPETTVEKNGFRSGDARLQALFRWIRSNIALPTSKEKLEIRLFKKLEKLLSKDSAYSRITREMFVFTSIGMKDRLDLFTCTHSGISTAYEGKAKQSKTNDVYQLRKYWDGCIHDGIAITDGVLVAAKHNDDVRALVAYLNTQVGEDGRPYHFRLVTWLELGIDPAAA